MFKELNPLLHSALRLAVMNKAGYVEVIKTFKGKMPCTICKITLKGLEAFEEYVDALKSYININT